MKRGNEKKIPTAERPGSREQREGPGPGPDGCWGKRLINEDALVLRTLLDLLISHFLSLWKSLLQEDHVLRNLH